METIKEINEIAGVMRYADGTYAPAIFTRDYADNWFCWVANKTPGGTTQRAAVMAARKTMRANKRMGIKVLNDHWTSYTNGPSMLDWFQENDCFTEDKLPMEITDHTRCNNCMLIQEEGIEQCVNCKTDAYLMQPFTITGAGEAEQAAIDWQHWFNSEDRYMSELADWSAFFTKVAKKFNLTDEFRENGII